MTGSNRRRILVAFVLCFPMLMSAASPVNSRTVRCAGWDQTYLYFSPEKDKDQPLPTVVLLHGAAAVAVHANRIAPEYEWIVSRAQRKTPIAIYIGDHDQFFSQDAVRKTRDLLRKAGFPVHYVELDHHDHNYYARADEINADAWKFMKEFSLPAR